MEDTVKQIIEKEGIQIIRDPGMFRQRLLDMNYPLEKAMAMELMLAACPAISATLSQREITHAEINIMISTVVKNANLSPKITRKLLGELLAAIGNKPERNGNFLFEHTLKDNCETEITDEEAKLSRAVKTVEKYMKYADLVDLGNDTQEKIKFDEAIGTLVQLSQNGNGYASYCLGMYFSSKSTKKDTAADNSDNAEMIQIFRDNSVKYFTKAADQGYGPAYGALAAHELNTNKNLAKAAAYFEYPTALSGSDGRQWGSIASKLLRYRDDNQKRAKSIIIALALSLLFTVIVGVAGGALWAVIVTAVLKAIAIIFCFCIRVFLPYYSFRVVYAVLIGCWLLEALIFI